MSNRRLYILVALLCTGLWAIAICLGHSNGQLRLLDRIESALTDLRTLARGVKADTLGADLGTSEADVAMERMGASIARYFGVPPAMVNMRASRTMRSTGQSREYPRAPKTCSA